MMQLGALLDDNSMGAALQNPDQYSKESMVAFLQERGYDFKDDKYFYDLLRHGNDEYFKEYLNKADLNAGNREVISSFEQVIQHNKGDDIIEYYLDNGVDLSAQKVGFNALHASMRNKNISLENIQRIIDAGVDVNARVPKLEMTPLMYAIGEHGNTNEQKIAKIELLLKNGADVGLHDTMGRDAYAYISKIADEKLKNSVISLLKKYEE